MHCTALHCGTNCVRARLGAGPCGACKTASKAIRAVCAGFWLAPPRDVEGAEEGLLIHPTVTIAKPTPTMTMTMTCRREALAAERRCEKQRSPA